MLDGDVVLVEYLSMNRGQHKIIGPQTKKFLGYRAGGDKFYIPKADLVAAPHLFRAVPNDSMIVREEKPQTPAPSPITTTPAPVHVEEVVVKQPEPVAVAEVPSMSSAPVFESTTQYVPAVEEDEEQEFDLNSIPGVTPNIATQLRELGVESYDDIIRIGEDRLSSMKGVAKTRAKTIVEFSTTMANAKEDAPAEE